jgi:hypothetical protein
MPQPSPEKEQHLYLPSADTQRPRQPFGSLALSSPPACAVLQTLPHGTASHLMPPSSAQWALSQHQASLRLGSCTHTSPGDTWSGVRKQKERPPGCFLLPVTAVCISRPGGRVILLYPLSQETTQDYQHKHLLVKSW